MTSIRQILDAARRSGLRLAIGAAGALPLALAPTAGAQGFGPDPFRPYNSQYDSAVYPIAPGAYSPFGAAGLNQNTGQRGANQFGRYLESLDDERGVGRRYDQANRAYDSQFGRQYQPNRKADAGFQERRAGVSELYFRYLRETDPRKRAALLQEYKQAQAEATRDLNVGARNARTTRTTRPRAGASTIPEAPEIDARSEFLPEPGAAAARSSATRRPAPAAGSAAPATGRTPSQVLERAQSPDVPAAPPLPGAPARSRSIPPPPPTTP